MITIGFHGTKEGTIQSGIFHLRTADYEKAIAGEGHERTSTDRSPGLSENRNKSYAFAQISASGNTEYDSTAVTLGLLGCFRAARSKSSEVGEDEDPLQAAKDASIVLSCAPRETSIAWL